MAKMKIGLVCPYNIYRSGGVQEHVLAQADELRRRGHLVKIIAPRPKKLPLKQRTDVILAGSSAAVKTPIKTTAEVSISMERGEIEDLLAQEKFDLLHVHEPEVPILASQIVAKASCPIVATFHALYPETAMAKTIGTIRIPYSRPIFNKLTVMTAVSEVASQFVGDQTKKRIHIIPNGIDLKKYIRRESVKVNPNIVYIGRLEKRKGVNYLLKAFVELKKTHPNLILNIAGDGPEKPKLKAFVKEKELTNVVFHGQVDDQKKIELLASASVFCSPALYGESFGIVLLEAMAMGVPIVAGNNPGYAALMKDRGTISIVDPKQTHEFSRRLLLMLFDEEMRKLWKSWAADYVKQFSYPNVVDAYEKLYQEIARSE